MVPEFEKCVRRRPTKEERKRMQRSRLQFEGGEKLVTKEPLPADHCLTHYPKDKRWCVICCCRSRMSKFPALQKGLESQT